MKKEQNNLDKKSSEELLKILIKENRASRLSNYKTDIERNELFLWDRTQQINANADSRTGWSTAFFALVISSLLAIGFGLGTTTTWYIVGSVMILPLISIILLIVAMNPHPTHKSAKDKFMEKEQTKFYIERNKYRKSKNFESLSGLSDASSKIIHGQSDAGEATEMMYKLIDKKRFLLNTAYKITFPFLIPFMISHKTEKKTRRIPKNKK